MTFPNEAPAGTPQAALGLPANWAPVPVTWSLAKMGAPGPGDVVTLHVVIVDGPTGRTAFALDDESMRRFVDACETQMSGIEIARGIVAPMPNGKHP